MRNKRRGFTLIELMIVAAIVSTFSTVMTVSMSGSTAKAKATAITSNVNACIEAAAMYAANHEPYELASKTADDVLKACMPKWADYSDTENKDVITYTALKSDKDKGADNWAVVVDFGNDPDKVSIKESLQKIKGYGKYYTDAGEAENIMGGDVYSFKVMLNSGKIVPDDTKKEEDSEN